MRLTIPAWVGSALVGDWDPHTGFSPTGIDLAWVGKQPYFII